MNRQIRLMLLVGLISLVTWGSLHYHRSIRSLLDKKAYVEFINNHPYANRQISLESYVSSSKFDRPDLAAEHNFLQVVDPRLKRIPTERLTTAYDFTKKKLKQKSRSRGAIKSDSRSIRVTPGSGNRKLTREAIPNVSWTERGPNNVGGRTRALMWDPNDPLSKKAWAGAVSGGIWFNNDVTNASSPWTVVNDFLASLAISSIVFDPNSTQTFYAGTGEGFIAGNNGGGVAGAGLYKSTDGGTTWNLLSSTEGPDFRYIQKVLVTGSSTVLITTRESRNEGGSGGIFRSTDGGATWVRELSGRAADLQLAANGDVYASLGIGSGTGSIWRSIDDGLNWSPITPTDENSGLWIELAVAPSQSSETSNTRIYALAQDADTFVDVAWFKRSDDGGDTWIDLEVPRYVEQSCQDSDRDFARGQAFYDLIVAVQPTNADVVTIGGIDLYRSTTAGTDMQLVSYWTGACDDYVHADQHEIVYRPGFPNEAIFGHDGGVSYSSNIGNANVSDPSFDDRNNNYSVTQFYAMAARNEVGSNNMLAGAQDNGTQRFSDGGGLTTAQAVGGDGTFCHIDQAEGNFQIASLQFNANFHSTDGGNSWTRITAQNTAHSFINPSDLDNDSHILYTAADENEYMLISNVNTSSPVVEEFVTANLMGNISHINADSKTEHRVFVGTRQGDIFQIDNANTPTPIVTNITSNITSPGNVSSISIGASDEQLLVTYSNFGVSSVWLTLDGGTTWTNKDLSAHGLPDIPVRWSLFNPNNTSQVLLATELGIWSTSNILASNPEWEPTSDNLANVRCDMLQYREADKNVFVATFGRGVFSTDVFATAVDADSPVLLSVAPADGAVEVFTNSTLSITFNEPVSKGSGTIQIIRGNDDSTYESIDVSSSSVSVDGFRVHITPTSDLELLQPYYILMESGTIQDLNGNAFAGILDKTTWNFQTFDGDFPPTVADPIGTVRVDKSPEIVTEEIDLLAVFTDSDNDNSAMTFSVIENGNPSLLDISIEDNMLRIATRVPNVAGIANVTVEASSNGKTVEDTFVVIVGELLLFAQTDNPSGGAIISIQMTDQNDTTVQIADDFVIPAGEAWQILSVDVFGFLSLPNDGVSPEDVSSFVVEIYGNSENGAPDNTRLLYQEEVFSTFTTSDNSARLSILSPKLNAGTYWLSVYAVSSLEAAQWNWDTRIGANGGEWHLNDKKGFLGLPADTWFASSELDEDFSNEDLRFTLAGSILEGVSPVSGLEGEFDENDKVVLSWIDNSDNETGFIIRRASLPEGPFVDVDEVGIDVVNFTDEELISSNTYYQVVAKGAEANADPSNVLKMDIREILTIPLEKPLHLRLYPNPVRNLLTLDAPVDADELVDLVIVDLSGKSHVSKTNVPFGQVRSIDLSGLGAGVYMLELSGTSFTQRQKFLKRE